MAKTRTTASDRSIKDCFIEIKGKASFELSLETNNRNDEEDGALTISNINLRSSSARKSIAGIREESVNDINISDISEVTKSQNPEEKENGDETGDDDKSDYGAESFFSDDSCKGSEVTNVTSRSSLSGSSSHLHSGGVKYDKRIMDLIKSRRGGERRRETEEEEEEEEDEEDVLSLLESELKYLSEEEEELMIDRRQLTRSGRRNMSFTNEELRKIERENQLLLKKIMSHQKPQNKSLKPNSGPPRTSSSAINRKKQQKKIEEDNMILLRRIQQAKPCAMPRISAPGCKLATM